MRVRCKSLRQEAVSESDSRSLFRLQREDQARESAGLPVQIINLRGHADRHGVDDPGPKACATDVTVLSADSVVLYREFGPPLRQLTKPDAHFTGLCGICVFTGVGDPLRHHDAEVDAAVSLELQRLEFVVQRGAVALA